MYCTVALRLRAQADNGACVTAKVVISIPQSHGSFPTVVPTLSTCLGHIEFWLSAMVRLAGDRHIEGV